jgi:hypothetical protein
MLTILTNPMPAAPLFGSSLATFEKVGFFFSCNNRTHWNKLLACGVHGERLRIPETRGPPGFNKRTGVAYTQLANYASAASQTEIP